MSWSYEAGKRQQASPFAKADGFSSDDAAIDAAYLAIREDFRAAKNSLPEMLVEKDYEPDWAYADGGDLVYHTGVEITQDYWIRLTET